MGERPSKGYSIDRINNNLGYYKENCKWSTSKEQANNRRSNRLMTLNNKIQTLVQWSEELNISQKTINSRVLRGWSDEDALTIKVSKTKERWKKIINRSV